MIKPVILLGAGGHAKVLLDMLRRLDYPVLGVTDPQLPVNSLWQGLPVLGNDDVLSHYSPDAVSLVNGIGSLPGDKRLRSRLFQTLKAQSFSFPVLIDPTAFVASDHCFEDGVQVLAGVKIQAGTLVAMNTIVNSGAIIEHDCRIGLDVHIAPGVVLSGGVQVGNHTHIGTGAVVIQGIRIGTETIIGAGSVVTHDIGDRQIVYPPRSLVKAIKREDAHDTKLENPGDSANGKFAGND